ncbi:uncharacterized protein FMAN_12251 [Fusarium mangiferae]|uniref:Uncharacterized protein n=1 Tax=Fusarium mangiferae TaxID=192010 RepID=A0A1L7TMZ6_FUSMA|nr:uncharacterized protein FMAN_12251 [Fusarium mangiferae]CVK98182.1 uncharacterized protein FMAN_12251 [Fusarium mangiferae]
MMHLRSKVSKKKYMHEIGNTEDEATGGNYWDRGSDQERIVVDKSTWNSNGCYPLDNKPTDYQKKKFEYKTLEDGEVLLYNSFMPTGQVYEFLPCAPGPSHAKTVIGYKKHRGMYKIMDIEGAPKEGKEDFMPYKLLLYRGYFRKSPDHDDEHRFIYLADPDAGDCFIRLEEIHNRMKGIERAYFEDGKAAIMRRNALEVARSGNARAKKEVPENPEKPKKPHELGQLLRFRCWAVEGFPCTTHELKLSNRLFHNLFDANDKWDHLDMFKVWAELLRKSQGDKLASKDFFGRYWDAVIPTPDKALFETGFLIKEVFAAVKRVLDAPRLKFRPTLTINNIVFFDQKIIPKAEGWDKDGWRSLEPHPGGLYTIYVSRPVREFLCRDNHDKPLWQDRYPAPPERRAHDLNELLTNCKTTKTTTTFTFVEHDYVVAARKGKRTPTQDKCVAAKGFSANAALSKIYPEYHPDVAKAKKRRVAEWLHRSAFSYGGITEGDLSSSQVPNNLVLGTPDTNTVMMRQVHTQLPLTQMYNSLTFNRYEAFVKRLAYYSNSEKHAPVLVVTKVCYPALAEWDHNWIQDAEYTWLAPELSYNYCNSRKEDKPHVHIHRRLHPLNRETCMLFEALLDKSMEKACWKWDCWDINAVAKALIESTALGGDQEGPFGKEDLKSLVKEAVLDDKGNPLPENDLEAVVQQDLDQRP